MEKENLLTWKSKVYKKEKEIKNYGMWNIYKS